MHSPQPWQGPPGGGHWVTVSADGAWFWDGTAWRPTAQNPWASPGSAGAAASAMLATAPPAAVLGPPPSPIVTADGLWWWTGYGWAPTLAFLAFQESERLRKLQTWLTIGAAALLFLR